MILHVSLADQTRRDVDDALDEIGRRGFGDARIFYELEVRAIADTSSIPPGDTQDKANYQRQCALWTIGLLNRPERVRGVPTNRIMGLDAIESVLNAKSEAPDVKAAAVQSLMVINRPEDRRIVSMLRKAMNDRNPNVRRLAHEALAGRVIE